MSNIFFDFLVKIRAKYIQDSHDKKSELDDMDNFIDTRKIMQMSYEFDKDIRDKLYKKIIESEELPEDEVNLVDLFGPIRAYNICSKLEPGGDYIETTFKDILTRHPIKYLKSYKYYIARLLGLMSAWLRGFPCFMEKIYHLGVFNKFMRYFYYEATITGYIQDISYGDIADIKFTKLLLSAIQSDSDTWIDVHKSFNIKVVKLLTKRYPNIIRSVRMIYEANVKNVICAKRVGVDWTIKSLLSYIHYSPTIRNFGLAARKHGNKTILHQSIEKIMQIFTNRNLTKLALYHV
jgi:hypothetical protein